MNVIIRKNYPVGSLPEDLRQGLGESIESVTIEIAAEGGPEEEDRHLEVEEALSLMRQMQHERQGTGVTEAEAVERIRSLRDDREA